MRDRLKYLILATGLNQKEFSERIGVSSSALTQFIKGQSKGLNSDTLLSIINEFNVNPTWLLTGEGEMFTSPPGSLSLKRETPAKVMQSDAPEIVKNDMSKTTSQKGHLLGIDGDVEFFEGDIDHVRWFRNLSRARQTAILAIAEIKDDEYVDEVKGSSLFKLRQERNAAKLLEEEKSGIHKKGETG